MSTTIETELFWKLPSSRKLLNEMSDALLSKRVIFLNIPLHVKCLFEIACKYALESTNIHDKPIIITVRSGTDIGRDVGVHFNSNRMSGGKLALLNLNIKKAVILITTCAESQKLSEDYAIEFMHSSSNNDGDIQLIMQLNDESLLKQQDNKHLQIIPYEAALSQEEMESYVNLRMLGRKGPANTKLYKAIVIEMSGYDPFFAEKLISLTNEQLLNIREYLPDLMNDDVERWRHHSWLKGAYCYKSKTSHTLRDVYLHQHASKKEKEKANKRINRMFWKACLKEITPWLEENRFELIKNILPVIRMYADNNIIQIPAGRNMIPVEVEELEYGNISGIIGFNKIKLIDRDQLNILYACKSAKIIRDEISHLRAPTTKMINDVYENFERVLEKQK